MKLGLIGAVFDNIIGKDTESNISSVNAELDIILAETKKLNQEMRNQQNMVTNTAFNNAESLLREGSHM